MDIECAINSVCHTAFDFCTLKKDKEVKHNPFPAFQKGRIFFPLWVISESPLCF